jgi:predicted regulator of Ras-like GTPase activity (Roadblock/LC7/MglB family)
VIRAQLTMAIEPLARLRGVRGAMVVDAHDGVQVEAILQVGEDGNRVAALAASLYRKARRSANAAGLGGTGFMQLEAQEGRVCLMGGEELLLVVVTDPGVNVGAVRMALLRAAETLSA